MNAIPRPEHPRPQFERSDWVNLNGSWTYRFDHGRSGVEAGWQGARGYESAIRVPFCPESALSGVACTDFIAGLWYHRRITVPEHWQGRDVLLHFGAVDYECEAYVDGISAGVHIGGTVSFAFDITALVRPGATHDLVVRAYDDTRGGAQPGGKQSHRLRSHGCHYTRTTGIWQTVWLEAVPPCGLEAVHIVPDLDGSRFLVAPSFRRGRPGLRFRAILKDAGKPVATAEGPAAPAAALSVPVPDPVPWAPGSPHLYDLELQVLDGDAVVDRVDSYAGLRKVHIEGNRVFLNNRRLYQRLVLDQGFYPDGIWTAPSDEALRRDIELSLAAGFNGARLHQKVFEERFHSWADRLGYLTWAESSSWGGNPDHIPYARNFLSEWAEILRRDRNHPSIIAWTPFNETRAFANRLQHARTHIDAYNLCKALDPTRPVNDASGYVHSRTDLWTVHNYEQDPAKLAAILEPGEKGVWRNFPDVEPAYTGQPYLVDEYGGTKWNPADMDRGPESWGYGNTPRSIEEVHARIEGLTGALLRYPHISGYCYTQLTDVEQEQNGIYAYDRSEKFDMARIRTVFSRRPDWSEI
ncbi:MAG: beta-glucuronidase [Lentisphaeria bacterium]|nr:beta-glucuronidase [Lentisphaeria bacterium]